MPPQRTIIVDTDRILTTIAAIADEQRAALMAESLGLNSARFAEALRAAGWAPRDLARLTGKQLTPSERIRTQQAVRAMERDGLVVLDVRHVRLDDAGRARVSQLQEVASNG